MLLKHTITRTVLIMLGVLLCATAYAQVSTDLSIIVTNSATPQAIRTLHIGVNPKATNSTDMDLGEDRIPPFPPTATFEARLISIGPADLLDGSPRDYRPWKSATQTDTFDLKLQAGTGGLPVRIKWSIDSVKAQYKNVRMIDAVTEGGQINVDMKTTGEAVITKGSLNEFYIIAEGPKTFSTSSVIKENSGSQAFRLFSSPNPASGNIVVRYTLPHAATVSLILTDVYGREVGHIAQNLPQEQGRHTLPVGVLGLPSGSYFCALIVDGVMQAQCAVLFSH